MARRAEEKERRRLERLAREEAERRKARAASRRRVAAVFVALGVTAGALAAWQPWKADPAAAFEYDPGGVAARTADAGLRPGDDPHVHPSLKVQVRDEPVTVPADMGTGAGMAPLHTHDPDGVIHVEGAEAATLGHFLALWGVDFDRDRLGAHRNAGAERVRMWVKDPKADGFRELPPDPDLQLKDEQEIYLYYGPPALAPIT